MENDCMTKGWGQLSLINGNEPITIEKSKFIIGRAEDCDLSLRNKLISGHHCFLERIDSGKVYLCDTSSNGTVLNERIHLKHEERMELKTGDKFHLIYKKKGDNLNVGFIVGITSEDAVEDLGTTNEYDGNATLPIDDKDQSSSASDNQKASEDAGTSVDPSSVVPAKPDYFEDTLLCSICQDILYDCVSIQPCLHSFCSPCLKSWMTRSRECPQCRINSERICRNHLVNSLVEAYLMQNPEKRRSEAEIKQLEENKIGEDELNPFKRKLSDSSVASDETDVSSQSWSSEERSFLADLLTPTYKPVQHYQCTACRQCPSYQAPVAITIPVYQFMSRRGMRRRRQAAKLSQQAQPTTAVVQQAQTTTALVSDQIPGTSTGQGGPPTFQCSNNQTHIICCCCLEPMPLHSTPKLLMPAQKCSICYRAFCHLYWGCQKQTCKGCLNALQNIHFDGDCLDILINSNRYESLILKDYLRSQKVTWKMLLDECMRKLASKVYQCDPGITPNTIMCRDCGIRCFQTLAYQYRKEIPKQKLPVPVTSRPDCYWGRNCRTQAKDHHSRNFNHICEQTRF